MIIQKISKRHLRAYKEQYWYAQNFLSSVLNIQNYEGLKILEIGTAEAGLLKYFSERGAECFGLEYSTGRYNNSLELNKEANLKLFQGDICDQNTLGDIRNYKFDIIILRDVIEHVKDKRKTLENIKSLLSNKGLFFISFPPKYSPFAGHQQVFPKWIGKIPYLHLLPNKVYERAIKICGLDKNSIEYYFFIKENRLSIKEFKRLSSELNFSIVDYQAFIIRPNYEYRYGIKRKKNIFKKIGFLREIFSLGAIFLLKRNEK